MKRLVLLLLLFASGSSFGGQLTTNEVDVLEVAFKRVLTRFHREEAVTRPRRETKKTLLDMTRQLAARTD